MITLPPRAELARRVAQLVPGLVAFGVGLALLVVADLGLGPWEAFHQGISEHTGVPIGTVGILVGIVVLGLWVPLRQRPGLGTLCNVIVIGLVIDLSLALAPEPRALVPRVACLGAGMVLVGLGSGLYIGAGLGPGPRDGLMTGLAARGHSLRLARTVIELSALAAGFALGGSVGVGTVVFALGIGPLVQLFLGRLTLPALTAPAE